MSVVVKNELLCQILYLMAEIANACEIVEPDIPDETTRKMLSSVKNFVNYFR